MLMFGFFEYSRICLGLCEDRLQHQSFFIGEGLFPHLLCRTACGRAGGDKAIVTAEIFLTEFTVFQYKDQVFHINNCRVGKTKGQSFLNQIHVDSPF